MLKLINPIIDIFAVQHLTNEGGICDLGSYLFIGSGEDLYEFYNLCLFANTIEQGSRGGAGLRLRQLCA